MAVVEFGTGASVTAGEGTVGMFGAVVWSPDVSVCVGTNACVTV